jgi:hypothetical protein
MTNAERARWFYFRRRLRQAKRLLPSLLLRSIEPRQNTDGRPAGR